VLPVSVLDLAPIVEGGTPGQALRNSVDLVRHAERLGYTRYWVAEHHNLNGIASAATSVVIAHLAQATASIRVGAGGIMLPNHAPLVIAEQFGTLEALHPGRIDLGLGRAPGTDQVTLRALRQDPGADSFPQDVLELQALLDDPAVHRRLNVFDVRQDDAARSRRLSAYDPTQTNIAHVPAASCDDVALLPRNKARNEPVLLEALPVEDPLILFRSPHDTELDVVLFPEPV